MAGHIVLSVALLVAGLNRPQIDWFVSLSCPILKAKRNKGNDGGVCPVAKPLAVNMVICETVLTEKDTDIVSMIRTMNCLTIVPNTNNSAHFFVVTSVASQPGDFLRQVMKVQMCTRDAKLVAEAPEYPFIYGYKIDPMGPGGFTLATEFTLDLSPLEPLGLYLLCAFVDGEIEAKTALARRRG
jgi:hypothetical protein